MNKIFERSLERLLAIEDKSFSNVSGDPGGETYFGISRVHWPNWIGWMIIDQWRAGEIDSTTRDDFCRNAVYEFYVVNFWNRMRCEEVYNKSEEVAFELFESSVNVGTHQAVKFLQEALNWNTLTDLIVDGEFGSQTMHALNRHMDDGRLSREDNEKILLKCMNGEQYLYYKKNPRHKKFRGWAMRT